MKFSYQNYVCFFLIALAFIYIFSVAPEPALGDSLSFTIQAYKGFAFGSNATNHFLYSNILALLHVIFYSINVHFLFTGFSIFCSILFLFYLNGFLIQNRITEKSAFICITILGLSFTFWRQSIITEVYTFYLLFVILFLNRFWHFINEKKISDFYKSSLLFGILFLIHIQSILFIPLYLYLLIKNFKILKKHLFFGLLIVLSVFSILLIPVIIGRNSVIDIFTDGAYRESLFNFDIVILFKSLLKNLGFLFYNFIFFLVVLFFGFKKLLFWDYILIGILPFLAFVLKHNVSDIYVFHLVPYLFLLIILGHGLDKLNFKYIWMVLLLPVFYFASFTILSKTHFGKEMESEKNFKGGARYIFFPPLRGNPDLKYFKKIYFSDSLYKKPELKAMFPFVLEWENIEKQYK